jgi:hypothetical protein
MPLSRAASRSAIRGLSLIEVAILLAITGLVIDAVIAGQELIHNARVRDIIAQQAAAEAALLAFQDRFRTLPGDYSAASTNINCGASPCLNGNGNGRVKAASEIPAEHAAWGVV